MKQTILTVAFVFAMSAAMHAQTIMPSNNSEQEITTVLEQMQNAFTKSDVSFFENNLGDTYIFTDPGGTVHNKSDMIDIAKGGNFKFESIIPKDRKITVYENTAVVTQHNTEKGHVGEEDISGEYRLIYVLNKQGDDWKIVAMQGTQIMKGE